MFEVSNFLTRINSLFFGVSICFTLSSFWLLSRNQGRKSVKKICTYLEIQNFVIRESLLQKTHEKLVSSLFPLGGSLNPSKGVCHDFSTYSFISMELASVLPPEISGRFESRLFNVLEDAA